MNVNANLLLEARSSMDQLEPIITNYLPPQANSSYHLMANVEIDLANDESVEIDLVNDESFSPSDDISILALRDDELIDNRLESFLKGIENIIPLH